MVPHRGTSFLLNLSRSRTKLYKLFWSTGDSPNLKLFLQIMLTLHNFPTCYVLQLIVDQHSSSCTSSVSNPHCACQGSCTVSFGRQMTKVCVLWASVKFKRHFPVLQGTHCVLESISRTRFSCTGFSVKAKVHSENFSWLNDKGTQKKFQLCFVSGSLRFLCTVASMSRQDLTFSQAEEQSSLALVPVLSS